MRVTKSFQCFMEWLLCAISWVRNICKKNESLKMLDTIFFWEEICSLSNFFCSSYLDMSLKKTFFTKICARPSLQSLFSLNSFFSFLYFWLLNRNCFLRKSRDKLISIKRHCLNCQTQNLTTSNLIITFGLCHNILLGK